MDDKSAEFCREMLPKTSRTFALTVPLLSSPLDEIVTTAYLLCRVVDTIEDEAEVPVAEQADLLRELAALAELPDGWRERALLLSTRAQMSLSTATSPDEVRLATGLPLLLDSLARMPHTARKVVHTCLRDMMNGMVEVLLRRQRTQVEVATVDDLLSYCDIVASTVGRMLTALFAWQSSDVAAVLPALEARSDAFGRALQLTNIIKDIRDDLDHDRCWLPRTLLADCGVDVPDQLNDPRATTSARRVLRRMIEITHRELVEAVAYIDALPNSTDTDVAIRRFCVAPLLMSVLTLRKVWAAPEVFGSRPLKISRRAVMVTMLVNRTAPPAVVSAIFHALLRSLPSPLPPDVLLRPVSNALPSEAVATSADEIQDRQSSSGA